MASDDKTFKKGCRNAWFLLLLAIVFVVGFVGFTYTMLTPEQPEVWDMNCKAFVPASSMYAQDYYDDTIPAWEAFSVEGSE